MFSAQPPNFTATSSAVWLPVWRYASRRPAKVLCSVYHGDHRPFRSKFAALMLPFETSANASFTPGSAPANPSPLRVLARS